MIGLPSLWQADPPEDGSWWYGHDINYSLYVTYD